MLIYVYKVLNVTVDLHSFLTGIKSQAGMSCCSQQPRYFSSFDFKSHKSSKTNISPQDLKLDPVNASKRLLTFCPVGPT